MLEMEIKKYVEIWKRKLEKQQAYIEEIRAIKHDMQAHMIVLQYYLDAENYESAKAYLQTMQDQPRMETSLVEYDLGNPLVNAIIEDCLAKTGEKVKLIMEGELSKEIKIEDYDLCILFSNLMSNAVEACERLSVLDKIIDIRTYTELDKMYILIKNPIEWELDLDIPRQTTTKEDKTAHGYGISNIQRVVEKYKGMINFYVKEEMFCVEIMLPIG